MDAKGWTATIVAFFLVLMAGCGGDSSLGQVSGVVKMDDQPLANALIQFSPANGGSPSAGRTDSKGEYSLRFSRDKSGAVIGSHKVTITTYQSGDADAEPPKPSVPEKVPVNYNRQSELTADVASGSNEINFDLQSSGKVIQPDVVEKIEDARGDQ